MLLQFKHGADEEDCPLPEDIRQDLLDFHQDLLAHCGEERGSERPFPRLSLETSPEVPLRFLDLNELVLDNYWLHECLNVLGSRQTLSGGYAMCIFGWTGCG